MVEPKYIRFIHELTSPSGKTEIWSVLTKDDEPTQIGEIKWNASWRCYSSPYDVGVQRL